MKNLFTVLVKRPIGSFLRWLEEERYKHNLARQELVVPDKGVYLSYAGQSVPSSNGVIHGGRVKLVHLAQVYPEKKLLTNIIYLVSSAVPQHAETLVRYLKGKGVKLVWNQNGVAYPAWDKGDYKTTNSRLASLLRMADYVVYQSEFCRLSADRYLGVARVPSKVLYNPVDTEKFSPSSNPPPVEIWQLLVTGTHLQPDRVLLILKTLSELIKRGQNAKLMIAGRLSWPDGDQETEEAIIRLKLKGHVELLGAYTQDQAPEIYQSAHILFHIKYKDPCPTVPIEAMSCSVPVIGSLSGGMSELVSDQGGILLEVPDVWDEMCYPPPGEMVDAVISIMADLDDWRHKARQRAVNHFSKEYWLEQHRQVFTEVL